MSLKDKLEVGLKPDAAYRPDNLPDFQKDDPNCQVAGQPGESRRVEKAREDCAAPVRARPARTRRRVNRKARRRRDN
jgi:hypothetical protein